MATGKNNVAVARALFLSERASLAEVRRHAEELRASRARIVVAADAERRKIERNLHDGAQQHLVALAVNLRLARDLVEDDPVRRRPHSANWPPMSRALSPSCATWLTASTRRCSPTVGWPKRCARRRPAAPSTSRCRPKTPNVTHLRQAAVYFCGLEALQNAAKHAPSSHVTVRLWKEDGSLAFEVRDSGAGFAAENTRPGQGFMNMEDRLGAIGGSVHWDSAPGRGTRVFGSVPLAG